MTQRSSDGSNRSPHEEGSLARRERRLAVLSRASQAIRCAHATAENAERARASADAVRMTSLENQALREAERDALRALEADVRWFANLLRTEGTPPEVAVRRLKSAVEPVVFSMREHDAGDVEWRRAVAGDVVRWFVEAYYAA